MFEKPVLLILFNRPDFTSRLFDVIRQVKPSRLFVAADGPRNEKEKELTDLTRSKISCIDWPCQVEYNYSFENLGCGKRPASAISWAFELVDELIIIEDDCLPNISFFDFCANLLDRYKNDNRIGTINGITIPHSADHVNESYYFSKFSVIWGWATWKRVWDNYDFNISDWNKVKNTDWLNNTFAGNRYHAKGFELMFDSVKKGWDVWDAQLFYMCLKQHYLNIHPAKNLVTNMGFDGSGTHTHQPQSIHANMPSFSIGPLQHPEIFVYDQKADEIIFNTLYHYKLPPKNLIDKMARAFVYRSKKMLKK